MSGRRRSSTAPHTRRLQPEKRLELIKRARAALPSLPTESLYQIHDLLERLLAEPQINQRLLEELDQALDQAAR